MGDRGHILDQPDIDTGSLQGSDRSLSSRTGAVHPDFTELHPVKIANRGRCGVGRLGSGEGGAFPASPETLPAGAGLSQYVAVKITDSDQSIVKSSLDMGDAVGYYAPILFLDRCFLFSVFCTSCHNYSLLNSFKLGLLLTTDSALLRTFSGSGVGMGSLSSNRQTPSVTQAPVTSDIHETFDIELDFFPEIALNPSFILNNLADLASLFLGEVFDSGIDIHACLLTDLAGPGFSDSVDISQRNLDSFIVRNVDSCNSHQLPPNGIFLLFKN